MKKKPIKIYFSDEYSDSSIKEIAALPNQNENKNQIEENKISRKPFELDSTDDEEYPDGNNPFVIQDTTPFELSSSDYDYSEPSLEHKTPSDSPTSSPISSPVEKFYNQTSNKMPFGPQRHTNNTYFFTYKKIETMKGPRFHYQFTLNEVPLFHTKTKVRHPTDPVRISSGNECHFSQKEYEGYLLINKKRNTFSLHNKTINGPELMNVEIHHVKGPSPKNTRVIFKNFSEPVEDDNANPNNRSQKDLILINLKPKKEEGHWTLNFNGKYAIPSVKNCILVKESSEDPVILFRRVSSNSCEIDAPDYYSPLCLFALGLSFFMSSI